jgi:4-amino-4-deoxy-L-arabinose transferase-like glycosyltransferase
MDSDQGHANVRQPKTTSNQRVPLCRNSYFALPIVLLVAGLLFFLSLGAPLLEPQEARYAEIPRQMLAEGKLLVPTLHGQPYLDKPPLLYWTVMASYRVFGVHDWSARLVPGLAGVLTVLSSYLWGRRFLGEQAGFCGALILSLAPEFVYRGRMLTFDTLLALWVTVSMGAAHIALSGPSIRRGWWLFSALACGLGLLTKGPVALALVAGPLVSIRFFDPQLIRPGLRGWAMYLAVVGCVALPWYLVVTRATPDFAGYFFWKHNVLRFVAPFDHAQPAWYYLPGLLGGLLPWTLLLPGLILALVRRLPWSAERWPTPVGFFLLAFAWILFFFSAAGCKRPTYLLPAFPPLALALGWYVHRRAPSWRALCQQGSPLAASGAVVTLIAGLSVTLAAAYLHFISQRAGLVLIAVMAIGLIGLALWPRRISWAGCAGVAFAVGVLAVQYLLPAYNRQFAVRHQLLQTAARGLLPGTCREPVICYPQRFDSVSFYLPASPVRAFCLTQRRELIDYLQDNPGTLILVKSGPVLHQLLRELPPGLTFSTRQRDGAITVGRVIHSDIEPRLLAVSRCSPVRRAP